MTMQKDPPAHATAVMPWAPARVVGACQVGPSSSVTEFSPGAAAHRGPAAHDNHDAPWGEGEATAGTSAVTDFPMSR